MWALTNEEFTGLMQQYQRLVYTVCLQFVHDPHTAEDLTQDTFLSAFSAIDRCEPQYYKQWLVRVAANKCKDHLKSGWRRATVALDAAEAVPAPAEEEGSLLSAVNLLPPKYRTVIYLYYYEGYAAREIAQLLGEKPATVSTQLNRGRQQLRTLLESEGMT